jgi:hypothetical protein
MHPSPPEPDADLTSHPPATVLGGAPGSGIDVVVDLDGGRAASEALVRAEDRRTAVWVGSATDAALEEFTAEIGRTR